MQSQNLESILSGEVATENVDYFYSELSTGMISSEIGVVNLSNVELDLYTRYEVLYQELEELITISDSQHKNVRIVGLMGMATFTSNSQKVSSEFQLLKTIFDEIKADHFKDEDSFRELSMGMSGRL